MKKPYPIMLDLLDRRCLVVGGGLVAERKVRALLRAGAKVTVVSPEATAGLVEMAGGQDIVLHNKAFEPNDIGDKALYMLVVAATNSAAVNKTVYEEANLRGLFINVVDQPELSTFTVPSVVRRGKLVLAISTGGASPALARKIALELETSYGEEYEVYLDFLSELRLLVQTVVSDTKVRQQLFKQMLEWDVLSKIRAGDFAVWKDELFSALEQHPVMNVIHDFGTREAGS